MKITKKVIVTGGAGFLGSTLVPMLIERGYEVHVIDSLVNGKKERIPPSARFYQVDITNEQALNDVFREVKDIYCVFHLAALPRVQFSIDHITDAHDTNINGLLNVFQAAREHKARRIVFSASSSAYGDQKKMPLVETMTPSPKSPYAMQKYFGELMCQQYAMHYGIETVALRYFNIFGQNFDPNGPYAMAIGKFITARKEGRPITVTGDGKQTRDCVHITDVSEANILAMESKKVGHGEVINIGSGKNFKILDIAKMIAGKAVPIQFIAPRVEPHDTKADIRKAKKLLGWTPKVSLKKGLAEML